MVAAADYFLWIIVWEMENAVKFRFYIEKIIGGCHFSAADKT